MRGREKEDISQLWDRIEVSPTGCLLWVGYVSEYGYGKVRGASGRLMMVHRIVYEAVKGKIPRGLFLDHLCRVRNCVNPRHLEPVTLRENILRGAGPTAMNARKTKCLRGHKFEGSNLYRRWDGGRGCRKCDAIRREKRKIRLLEAANQ